MSDEKEYIESLMARRIIITKKDGKKTVQTIKRIIPMFKNRGDYIEDVEILTNKKRNFYFSLECVLDNKSWVKEVEITLETDKRYKGGRPAIANYISRKMTDENYRQAFNIIKSVFK